MKVLLLLLLLVSLARWVGIPVCLVLTMILPSWTQISVLKAPVSLAWNPVYLILIVSFNYHRLQYQSWEHLSPMLDGLESQFI